MQEVRQAVGLVVPLSDTQKSSGFNREDEWGYRAMEPSRCCISSIALVLLKTGIAHQVGSNGEKQVSIDYVQMGTAQKLLLFWRKPAVCVHSFLVSTSTSFHPPEEMLVGWYRRQRR